MSTEVAKGTVWLTKPKYIYYLALKKKLSVSGFILCPGKVVDFSGTVVQKRTDRKVLPTEGENDLGYKRSSMASGPQKQCESAIQRP